jgi:hypothetical protein
VGYDRSWRWHRGCIKDKGKMCMEEVQVASPGTDFEGASLRLKGKIYGARVCSMALYGNETWTMKIEDKQRLEMAERMMVRRVVSQ